MIVSDLFEEIPIASGAVNPATGKAWLPSELRAAQAQQDAEEIRQAKLAASTQSARDEMENPGTTVAQPVPLATSSTAPTPSSIKYAGALAPKKKVASNFTQTSGAGYKMPGTPSTPTVPNMTQAPAKVAAPVLPAPEPITIGGQKISPSDPAYAKIMKNAPTVAEPVQDLSGQKAAEQIAVKDITNQVSRQMKLVKTKDDLKKIKQLIDRQFTRHGLVSESAFAKRDILVKRADAKLARILK